MFISRDLLDALIADAQAHAPNECCGLIAIDRATAGPEVVAQSIVEADTPRGRGVGDVGVELAIEMRAVAVHPMTNIAASPLRFEIDGKELLEALNRLERSGHELGGLYHSHTRTAPYPSQTDINFAALWPGVEWVIVGLSDPDNSEVRSYRIDDGVVDEVAIST